MGKRLIRGVIYLVGMLVLATALTLYTKTGLGVSSVLSVPFVVSAVWQLDFGNTTFVFYAVFVLAQAVIHFRLAGWKWDRSILLDLLQLPFSLLFTRVMNLVSAWVPLLTESDGFFGTVPARILVLVLAVILTGIGAATTLNMRLIPNPSDGMMQALSDLSGKKVGTVKNIFDACCVCAAIILALAATGRVVGIGLGTLLAALGIGRVIAVYNCLLGGWMRRAAGLEE